MTFECFEVDAEWLKSLDLERQAIQSRTGSIQCGVYRSSELGWTVLHFLAPMGKGLLLLREYSTLSRSMHRVFSTVRNGSRDEESLQAFKRHLKRSNISFQSAAAFYCFGVFPRLWGDAFGARHRILRIARRYESIAVPSDFGPKLISHFQEQMRAFGDGATHEAGERELLFLSSNRFLEADALLLDNTLTSGEARRQEIMECIDRILKSPIALASFGASLSRGLRFAGGAAIVCGLTTLPNEFHRPFRDLARARVSLLCALRWPHFLDHARDQLLRAEAIGLTVYSDLLELIEQALLAYPVVSENPLANAEPWLAVA